MKKSRKTSAATEEDTLPETMSQLNIASPSSTHPADDQHQTAPSHSLDLAESPPTSASGPANQKTQTPSQSATREAVGQNEAMTVKVLDVSKPFEYKSTEKEVKMMFYAKVATVNEYFNVKVLNMNLIQKFEKDNVIKITNYDKVKGHLEIQENSPVTEADPDEMIEVPKQLITIAKKTPMISDINKIVCRAPFYGSFTLNRKKVYPLTTVYEMKDDTGTIEVVGRGRCSNVSCEKGDKLEFFDFEMTTDNDQAKLESGDHSFIKVTKAGNKKVSALHPNPNNEEESDDPQN